MRPWNLAIDDLDGALVHIDELVDHRQSDAGAAHVPAWGATGIERVEDPGPVFMRNTGAAIAHLEHQLLAAGPGTQIDDAAARGVLDCIGQQVLQNQADLAPISDQRHVLDAHIEPHPLRHQSKLLVLEYLLDHRPQTKLGDVEAGTVALPGAEAQQILDQPLQLDAIVKQNRGDLALPRLELADRTVHQQLGALADIGERCLQFVRQMPQEAVALLCQLQQPGAQPFELVPEPLKVHRAIDYDAIGKITAPQLTDGAVDLPQWPAQTQREQQYHDHDQRQQQRRLEKQLALRLVGAAAQFAGFDIDLLIVQGGDAVGQIAQQHERLRQLGRLTGGNRGLLHQRPDLLLRVDQALQLPGRIGGT